MCNLKDLGVCRLILEEHEAHEVLAGDDWVLRLLLRMLHGKEEIQKELSCSSVSSQSVGYFCV